MKTNHNLPDSGAWNHFWKGGQNNPGGRPSWSKQRILAMVSPYLREGVRVLDAGCGSGFFSGYFSDQGARVTALDYSEEALALVRALTRGRPIHTVRADLVHEDLRVAVGDRRYDMIFTDGLFEHFSPADQDRILENFLSVLENTGVIITVAPNRWSPWQLIRPMMMPGISENPFVLKGLVRLHERNGLRVVSQGGLNVLPWQLSPECLGPGFGMIVYAIAMRKSGPGDP